MPPFPSPKPRHRFNVASEKATLTRHFRKRGVPKSQKGTLLLATWNIANLGAQKRTPAALELIAHILRRFDLIAVQEVNDNFSAFYRITQRLGPKYDFLMTDTAGNNERLAFLFRTDRVKPANLFGELSIHPRQYPKRTIKVRFSDAMKRERVQTFKDLRFTPFDRNPYIGSFESGRIRFTLANVHLYYGGVQRSRNEYERRKYARRVLEIYALARWAERRASKSTTYNKNIVLLGDMNVPAMDDDESTHRELVRFGWQPVEYVTKTAGSNLGNDKTYDQMAFAPSSMGRRVKALGVFDFDNAAFASLWQKLAAEMPVRRAIARFNGHMKYHISDHRPLWVQLDTT